MAYKLISGRELLNVRTHLACAPRRLTQNGPFRLLPYGEQREISCGAAHTNALMVIRAASVYRNMQPAYACIASAGYAQSAASISPTLAYKQPSKNRLHSCTANRGAFAKVKLASTYAWPRSLALPRQILEHTGLYLITVLNCGARLLLF